MNWERVSTSSENVSAHILSKWWIALVQKSTWNIRLFCLNCWTNWLKNSRYPFIESGPITGLSFAIVFNFRDIWFLKNKDPMTVKPNKIMNFSIWNICFSFHLICWHWQQVHIKSGHSPKRATSFFKCERTRRTNKYRRKNCISNYK